MLGFYLFFLYPLIRGPGFSEFPSQYPSQSGRDLFQAVPWMVATDSLPPRPLCEPLRKVGVIFLFSPPTLLFLTPSTVFFRPFPFRGVVFLPPGSTKLYELFGPPHRCAMRAWRGHVRTALFGHISPHSCLRITRRYCRAPALIFLIRPIFFHGFFLSSFFFPLRFSTIAMETPPKRASDIFRALFSPFFFVLYVFFRNPRSSIATSHFSHDEASCSRDPENGFENVRP